MPRLLFLLLLLSRPAAAVDPVRAAWILGARSGTVSVASLPEVHSASVEQDYMVVRSSGISLKYLGPLQTAPVPSAGVREFVFRIPLRPAPADGRRPRVPPDVVGAFLNGLPIYNQFEALSWNAANLWHYDAVAYNDDGNLTAAGHPRPDLTHPAPAGLLEQLVRDSSRHSPLIGFALDGYPVYGPWAFANPDGTGGLRRMRSSYRLRSIARRETWPDGTDLLPEQYGPDVSPDAPLGTFAEDYEYVAGAGDLDQSNGRFTRTPEYPHGTYAYFLTTDASGKLAFPYLVGPRFYGRIAKSDDPGWHPVGCGRIDLAADSATIRAGRPVRFRLQAHNVAGDLIRFFEYIHERPIHLLVASSDLSEFEHIHPELSPGDTYQVEQTFPHGGKYRFWADYSLPGEPSYVEAFDVTVEGPRPAAQPLVPGSLTQTAGSLSIQLTAEKSLRAGEDIPLTLQLSGDRQSLEPYLGAWAHVIVIGKGFRSFAHAHPVDSAAGAPLAHSHTALGPPPDAVHIVTSFPTAGTYKLWAQFQKAGKVLTAAFVLQVAAPAAVSPAIMAFPAEAIRIRVTPRGFDPPRIQIPAGKPVTLAFTRDAGPNCGAQVVFPALDIRRDLPLGGAILVQLPAQSAGEISFACGMGMFRGMIVAR